MEDSKQRMADLMKALQNDRLISITIGSDPLHIQIQQTVLEAASAWFKNVLKHNSFVEGKSGKIDFPDDDPEAWKILACWITTREFLTTCADTTEDILVCAKCWILGDKYDIKPFQDEAMMELIQSFNENSLDVENREQHQELEGILKLCRSGSKLAILLTEEITFSIDQNNGSSATWDSIGHMDVGHLWQDFCNAHAKLVKDRDWEFSERLGYKGERVDSRPWWKDYMVGDKMYQSI
ncbi:hypothetical protein HII31_11130 [Pseudocercospora fuligena]|uniref:BTB domain-containing protein n=1 Tax=Pseudocercospora fuligena TaxID=685502 RepID=A0A8H6RCI1_9PEZI|nr:hypothetical protein HII31_11130 [Pseudocercospora fuligena]